MAGPLSGYRVIELAGLGPGPFAGMMLSDMGAEVVRVERAQDAGRSESGRTSWTPAADPVGRGRRSVAVDLKLPAGRDVLLRMAERADALIEVFRPGVAERLGVGPDECLACNPKLVYGRMTGWGQTGPWASSAGHDINYTALSGTLGLFGRRGDAPVPPVNLIGDFGGGGMLLAFGIVCAILEATRSGRGQVIDAAMVDGAALLAQGVHGYMAVGEWGERGTNLLDTGAWFYEVYETADHQHVSLGSLEPKFFRQMLERTGLAADVDGGGPVPRAEDRSTWPAMKERLAALIRTRTRAEWIQAFDGSDACFAPVLTVEEAAEHPHNVERGVFTRVDGVLQASPAPRFSRTPGEAGGRPRRPGEDTREVLADWGFSGDEIEELTAVSAVR